jgi:hypothetical protein
VKVQRLAVSVAVALAVAASFAAAGVQSAAANTSPKTSVIRFTPSAPQQQQLRALYAAYRGIPLADVAQVTSASVRGARMSPGGAQWAVIRFVPSASAPQAVAIRFQDGAGSGIFTRPAGGTWRAAGLGGEPFGCGTLLPSRVRLLWGLPSCAALTWTYRPRAGQVSREEVATVAEAQIGISDNPAERNFNGLDCDPYTAIEAPWVSTTGCGVDPTFNINDGSELWCADFAKWVWLEAGVKRGVSVLTPAAASFFTWGEHRHEGLRTDAANPRVGDAVVFYPAGSPPNGHYADHVGIVSAVNPDGSIDLVNGDFLSTQNISVQTDDDITNLGQWAGEMWGTGEQWVFVKPRFPHTTPPPPASGTRG